ncbi:MAG TPA: electron transport complex subunit RsxB [Burkholderiaceae bacterium]|nr:electron transport complex subunit RsxB [Burkholderiaceae bacterium]
MTPIATLADRVNDLLPQTQCNKCGHDGCRPYAEAIAAGAAINQCPPGGAAGIERLARLTGRPIVLLNPGNGSEGPLRVAVVDEALCIGCTLCIQACPVDAIVGAVRAMHTVIPEWCNGCDLCVAPCPMDCIAMVPVEPPRVWSDTDARTSRARYEFRLARLARESAERAQALLAKAHRKLQELEQRDDLDAEAVTRKRTIVQTAIERARARRQQAAKP